MTKKPMTIEEMVKRWPNCPPFEATTLEFWKGEDMKHIIFKINQDTIKEVRDYLDAVEECMNG